MTNKLHSLDLNYKIAYKLTKIGVMAKKIVNFCPASH